MKTKVLRRCAGWCIAGMAVALVAGATAGCRGEADTTTAAQHAQPVDELIGIATPAFRNLGKRGESDL